ncbi:MAG: lipoyl(octanoyl) transferase [Candidatus Azotimanducaceae bacterium]|jgi:lipoyl(octanoyl) transferase|tara:strand:+ start:11228 stop:11890 length:663 start_codon:yes stop_codon:yes gene_type:complete
MTVAPTDAAGTRQNAVKLVDLGETLYEPVYSRMQDFTRLRTADTPDEIWLTEHKPVFTQGQAGKAEHILFPGSIPVVQSNRGGQVTYHGPGQITVYLLLDLRRLGIGVRDLVSRLEAAVQGLLGDYQVVSRLREDAPGVYIDNAKIASLGLRVSRGCSYHGLSLNVAMDLQPFSQINPCGLTDISVTHLFAHHESVVIAEVRQKLCRHLLQQLKLYESST